MTATRKHFQQLMEGLDNLVAPVGHTWTSKVSKIMASSPKLRVYGPLCWVLWRFRQGTDNVEGLQLLKRLANGMFVERRSHILPDVL